MPNVDLHTDGVQAIISCSCLRTLKLRGISPIFPSYMKMFPSFSEKVEEILQVLLIIPNLECPWM